jgi:hypothetical protein
MTHGAQVSTRADERVSRNVIAARVEPCSEGIKDQKVCYERSRAEARMPRRTRLRAARRYAIDCVRAGAVSVS